MNFGYLSGYFGQYKLVNTQFIHASAVYTHASTNTPYGAFYAPEDATHALITACGKGGGNGGTGGGAGGGGASCYRIVFSLKPYRYIPYMFRGITSIIIGASNYQADLGIAPILGGMNSVVLTPGALGSGASGGAGGAATFKYRQSSTTTAAITASGGAGGGAGANGGSGLIQMLADGGILAGGGGGGGYQSGAPPTVGTGGDVPAPWGTQTGGRPTGTTGGGGGASLFSRGGSVLHNLPGSAYINITTPNIISAPGAGQAGSTTTGITAYGWGFIYCEFVKEYDGGTYE